MTYYKYEFCVVYTEIAIGILFNIYNLTWLFANSAVENLEIYIYRTNIR
jgi:hypothetical protein